MPVIWASEERSCLSLQFLLLAPLLTLHTVVKGQASQYGHGKAPASTGPFQHTPGSLPETTMECKGEGRLHRVCSFYNLKLWNGTYYYTTTDKGTLARGLPAVPLSWLDDHTFSPLDLSARQNVLLVRPEALPAAAHLAAGRQTVAEAVLWTPTFEDNYGHLLGEHGPSLHTIACTYLGRCHYSPTDLERLHLLTLEQLPESYADVPGAGREMLSCFSKHGLLHAKAPHFEGALVLVERLVVGIGPVCRAYPYCRTRHGRGVMSREMVESWKQRMAACVGVPQGALASGKAPTVLLVDRPVKLGRAVLNIRQLRADLKKRLGRSPPFLYLDTTGVSLAEQAQAYAKADILIQAHGAALGNLIFLPQGAAVIDLVPQNNLDKHAWLFHMAADFHPLYFNPKALLPQKSVLLLNRVKASPEWALLPVDVRRAILQDGTCPTTEALHSIYDPYLVCNFSWFLKASNLVVDSEALARVVELVTKELSTWQLPTSGYVTKRFKLW